MCGIGGIHNLVPLPPPSIAGLRRMTAALRHRGPDGAGIYRDRFAGLTHTRLAIVDRDSGHQPLTNESGTIWISFNGEIYNYAELRRTLAARGHVFRTATDTEVIVHAYEEWRDEAFERVQGQWAVAIWDRPRRRLTLSRDPYGISPLYIYEQGGRVLFASEIKGIFAADPTIRRALDPAAIEETFTFWTVVAPQTAFEGVQELEPGHSRAWESGRTWTSRRRDSILVATESGERRGANLSLDRAVAATRDRLETATSLRVHHGDVRVGAYLSGGLDSSMVTALATQARPSGSVETFSVRFEDGAYDEGAFQREVAQWLGTRHHEITISRRQIAACFQDVILHAERPILRTAPAPLFLLSREVRNHGIKAVLTGEGADEVFAGYDVFKEAKIRGFWARQPRSVRRPRLLTRLYSDVVRSPFAHEQVAWQFFGRGLDEGEHPAFSHHIRWSSTARLKRFIRPELRRAAASTARDDVVADLLRRMPPDFMRWEPLARAQHLEAITLMSGYLLSAQGDRMLMAHSVEGRYPFLDAAVIDLAKSLPASYKLRVLDEKFVLKRAARGLVPPSIVNRVKRPYRAPDAVSFVGSNRPDWLPEIVGRQAIEAAGMFLPDAVERLWKKLVGREGEGEYSNADNMAAVGIVSTQLLHHQFIAGNLRWSGTEPRARLIDRTADERQDGDTWSQVWL